MGRGIIFIEKLYAGETWENSYPFQTSNLGVSILNDNDLVSIGADLPITAANSNILDVSYNVDTPLLLRAIIAFERQMHPQTVTFTKAYVSDGSKNSAITDIGPLHSTFATKPLNFQGLNADIADTNILSGNTVLKIQRLPSGFSQKASAVSYRCVLSKLDVHANGRRLVGWDTTSDYLSRQSRIVLAIGSSNLDAYFGDGDAGVFQGIGKHAPSNNPTGLVDKGDLLSVSKIVGMSIQGPFSRQVPRGRRRTA